MNPMQKEAIIRSIRNAIRSVKGRPEGMGRIRAIIRPGISNGGMGGSPVGPVDIAGGLLSHVPIVGNLFRAGRGAGQAMAVAPQGGRGMAALKNVVTSGGMPGRWTMGDTLGTIGGLGALGGGAYMLAQNDPQMQQGGMRLLADSGGVEDILGDQIMKVAMALIQP